MNHSKGSVCRYTLLLTVAVLLARAQVAPSPAAPGDVVGPASRIQAPPAKYAFPNGVTYTYTGEWRLWTAGSATLRMERSGEKQRVMVAADSAGFVSLLYHVHDRFEALFDPRTFCSERVTKHTEEGFRRKETTIQFDYQRRKAVLDERNLKSNETKHAEEDIPGCVTDVLSGIYYLASLPLYPDATYKFPVNDGGKTVDVTAHVEGKEQIKTDAGTFNTIRVRTTSSGIKGRAWGWIWFSDDAARIPVQLRGRALWGTLTFTLQRVER